LANAVKNLLSSPEKIKTMGPKPCPPPVFYLAMTGVNPLRGFIRPTLRANGIKTRNDPETRFPLEIHAAKL